MKKFLMLILLTLAQNASGIKKYKTSYCPYNRTYYTKLVRRPRKMQPTRIAKNSFTFTALSWSAANAGWVHKVYNVDGKKNNWNMPDVKIDLLKAYVPSAAFRRSFKQDDAPKTNFYYKPEAVKNTQQEKHPPSYYLMGGPGYKTEKEENQ